MDAAASPAAQGKMTGLMAAPDALTPASIWNAMTGSQLTDRLLDWPPDLFALTDVILDRSQAYRFGMSPPTGMSWPPDRSPGWPEAVQDAGQQWSACIEDESRPIPDLLAQEWAVFREGAEKPLEQLAAGHDWRTCEALLTLHAIADEACAGLAGAFEAPSAAGWIYRARARELLARTGSAARIQSALIRVLPKICSPPVGTSIRSWRATPAFNPQA